MPRIRDAEWQHKYTEIPDSIMVHLEELAREIHHSWVEWKVLEGFKYGDEKDYKRKIHPHFLHWDDLPPEHRASDYLAARAALKALVALGIIKDETVA